MWQNIVIGLLLAYSIIREIIWWRKEVDLVDRALPRNEVEKIEQRARTQRRKSRRATNDETMPAPTTSTVPGRGMTW